MVDVAAVSQYLADHTEHRTCRCSKCEEATNGSHMVDLTWIVMSKTSDLSKDRVEELVGELIPDSRPRSVSDLGECLGDYRLALQVIGLGHLAGCWQAVSPDVLFPSDAVADRDLKRDMAEGGCVAAVRLGAATA